MFVILLHSSKTMRSRTRNASALTKPRFAADARELASYVAHLPVSVVARCMGTSEALGARTLGMLDAWNIDGQTAAIDAFVGDIYSGLRAASLSSADRTYAQQCLYILSGLYGVLRPNDGIAPYRLEMGYRFPDKQYANLYTFWGSRIADVLPKDRTVVNTSSAEYTRAVLPHLKAPRVITPRFLTLSEKTGQPTPVTVHTKIARGAFARWLIINRIEDESRLPEFNDLGYQYDAAESTHTEPTYVATRFGGIGLSVRLSAD